MSITERNPEELGGFMNTERNQDLALCYMELHKTLCYNYVPMTKYTVSVMHYFVAI